MPQVLTMTRKQGETDEQFAARITSESTKFFSGSKETAPESTAESTPETSPEPPTDVSAGPAAPAEEPATST
jgi:hypothetical protein